jgi:hypothetical protein
MLPTGRQTRSSSKAQLAAAVAATSLNDDDDKKNPPPSAAAATSDPLSASTLALLQTDAVIASISSFLASAAGSSSVTSCYLRRVLPSGGSDLLNLSEGCKGLRFYGSKLEEVTLFYPKDLMCSGIKLPVASLLDMLRRQEHLVAVTIQGAKDMLSPLFSPTPSGYFQHVEYLRLEQQFDAIRLSALSALADAIAVGGLPLLKKLHVNCDVERGALKVLMEAFGGGASPGLHTLMLPFSKCFLGCDGRAPFLTRCLSPEEEEDEVESNLATTIDVLERRRQLGTCADLKQLDNIMYRPEHGALQVRLLTLLLPSVETLPSYQYTEEVVAAIEEIGAPCVKQIVVGWGDPPVVVEAMTSMMGLEELTFDERSLTGSCVNRLISVIERYKGDFLPKLKVFRFKDGCFWDVARDAGRLFKAVGEASAFASVRRLSIEEPRVFTEEGWVSASSWRPAVCGINLALTGALCGLQQLTLKGIEVGGGHFDDFCRALETSPSAASLTNLCLKRAGLSTDNAQTFAALVARGSFPLLQALDFSKSELSDVGVTCLMESFATVGTMLTILDLEEVGMGLDGLKAFASALEGGALRSLVELNFSGNSGIDDRSAIECLSVSMQAGHLSNMKVLELKETSIGTEGAKALAAAIVVGCPELRHWALPGKVRGEDIKLLEEGVLKDFIQERNLQFHY